MASIPKRWVGQALDDLMSLPLTEVADKYGITYKYAKMQRARVKKRIKERVQSMEQPSNPTGEVVETKNGYEFTEQERKLGELLNLLEESGIDLSSVAKINSVQIGDYQGFIKNNEGEIETTTLKRRGISFTPVSERSKTDFVREATPTIIRSTKSRQKRSNDHITAVIPDIQVGYRRHGNELEPIHDEKVISVGLQIIRDLQPDVVVLLGDNLDLPEFSRYDPDSDHFRDVTQSALDYMHKLLAQLRADVGDKTEIVYLAGNHDARLMKYVLKHNMGFAGLRRANVPEEWAVLTVPNLLRLDELGVKWVSGYPANRYMITDNLQAIHGHAVKSNGSSASLYANREEFNTLFGHVHRIESHTRTTRTGRFITAASFGTWARIDGAVPSYGNGVDDRGQVVQHYENWQNAMGVARTAKNGSHQIDTIHIRHDLDYETSYAGKLYTPSEP